MKYFFRDRIERNAMLATYHKINHVIHLDHHDYHPHFELYFRPTPIEQEIVLNGSAERVDGPCVVLTSPFSIHAMSTLREDCDTFERYIVYFNESFIKAVGEAIVPQTLFSQDADCMFALSQAEADTLAPLLEPLFDTALPESERAAVLALFLARLNRLVAPERRHHFGKVRSYIPRILQYLYQNGDQPLYAEEIAERFHVSRAKLNRDFRASVGQSLHQAIIDLRIANAMRLLTESKLSMREVALQCGFSSEFYFHTAFKRVTGLAPTAWRRQHRRS